MILKIRNEISQLRNEQIQTPSIILLIEFLQRDLARLEGLPAPTHSTLETSILQPKTKAQSISEASLRREGSCRGDSIKKKKNVSTFSHISSTLSSSSSSTSTSTSISTSSTYLASISFSPSLPSPLSSLSPTTLEFIEKILASNIVHETVKDLEYLDFLRSSLKHVHHLLQSDTNMPMKDLMKSCEQYGLLPEYLLHPREFYSDSKEIGIRYDKIKLSFEGAILVLFMESKNNVSITMESFLKKYPDFSTILQPKLGKLLRFCRAMIFALQMIEAKQNKKHLLNLVTVVTEGHVIYHTGSGAKRDTIHRVIIYEREGNITKGKRPPRKSESSQSPPKDPFINPNDLNNIITPNNPLISHSLQNQDDVIAGGGGGFKLKFEREFSQPPPSLSPTNDPFINPNDLNNIITPINPLISHSLQYQDDAIAGGGGGFKLKFEGEWQGERGQEGQGEWQREQEGEGEGEWQREQEGEGEWQGEQEGEWEWQGEQEGEGEGEWQGDMGFEWEMDSGERDGPLETTPRALMESLNEL